MKIEKMGQIHLEGMEFYAYHGHFKEEQIVGNRFIVDIVIDTNMEIPAQTDDLNDAVNYQIVYEIVKREMNKKSHLLEHIAQRVVDNVYQELKGIKKIYIKVSKMNPPIGGKMHCVSVSLTR